MVPREHLIGFVLVTSLFSLWGFANDITNPMVAAFKTVLLLSNVESALVQTAFYGGYCLMSIPAAMTITRFTYKTGIVIGLSLYSIGCLLFLPAGAHAPTTAGSMSKFALFLLAYVIMTCGLSFLETSCNPYILSMGSEETATARLNLAQAFNPMGSLGGMLVARSLILARLDNTTEEVRFRLVVDDPDAFLKIAEHDLAIIRAPYATLGIVVACFFAVFIFAQLPQTESEDKTLDIHGALHRLCSNSRYAMGVVTQCFYVGAQICCWTFIIQYGELTLNMSKGTAQTYNIIAMVSFVTCRFIFTFMLRFVSPSSILACLGLGGSICCLGAIFLPGMMGLLSLVLTSCCMSLMFPTIYGISLEGLGDDAKLGSAGLILAIGGGAVSPALQAKIIDAANVRISFVVPLISLLVVMAFGLATLFGRDTQLKQSGKRASDQSKCTKYGRGLDGPSALE